MSNNWDQPAIHGPRTVFWAGNAVAAGAFGVILSCVLYAASPVAAVLPGTITSLDAAVAGMQMDRTMIHAAGCLGFLSNIVLAAGTLLMMAFRIPATYRVERVGWAIVTLSVVIFLGVDTLASGVLIQLAALNGPKEVFLGFKLLYNILFVTGTIAFGLGVPCIFVSEMKSSDRCMPKPILFLGMCNAIAGLVSGLLYLLDLSMPHIIGANIPLIMGFSIAFGSLIFVVYGIQIARTAQ